VNNTLPAWTANQENDTTDCFGMNLEKQQNGLLVTDIKPGSAAHLLGFRKGWNILLVNGVRPGVDYLCDVIYSSIQAQKINIGLVLQNKKRRKKYLRLLRPGEPAHSLRLQKMQDKVWDTAGLFMRQCLDTNYNAIFVSAIKEGSRAERSGFRLLDKIIFVNESNPKTLEEFYFNLLNSKGVNILIESYDGQRRSIGLAQSMLLPSRGQLNLEAVASRGEKIVSDILQKIDSQAIELRSVIIPYSKDHGTEIDHIFISQRGVFVIETKFLSGLVSGSYKDRIWTQYRTTKDAKIFNPIWQNNHHACSLKKILDKNGIVIPVIPVVVLIGCEFNLKGNVPVVTPQTLVDFILRHPKTFYGDINLVSEVINKSQVKSFNIRERIG